MSLENAKEFLEILERDESLQIQLRIEASIVALAQKLSPNLVFTVGELDKAIEEKCGKSCSTFLQGLGFSEVPGF